MRASLSPGNAGARCVGLDSRERLSVRLSSWLFQSHVAFLQPSCRAYMPSLFAIQAFAAVDEGQIVDSLQRVRPRLVSGFESSLMARMLAEEGSAAEMDILNCPDWLSYVEELLVKYDCSREELQGEFERWRRNRLDTDFQGWIALNPLYKGVRDAIHDCQCPTYFASSKAGERLVPLLRSLLDIDVDIDSPRIFHSLIPPNELKLEALKSVLARPVAADSRTILHFIDDRFETIEYILKNADQDLLKRYQFYLASWGYCTTEEIDRAKGMPGVRVISLEDFCELLRFGIVMNVHDGCQDTEEEARNAVYKPNGPL